jgi:hypothetical protein
VTSAAPESGKSPSLTDEFLMLLRNERELPRDRGFVVLLPAAKSLEHVQHLCLEERSLDCLCARYGIYSPHALGTALAAFVADIEEIRRRRLFTGSASAFEGPTNGVISWRAHSGWPRAIRDGFVPRGLADAASLRDASRGVLGEDWLNAFLTRIADDPYPRDGQIIVLCEVRDLRLSPDADSGKELAVAMNMLFDRLPKNVGIVIAGVPTADESLWDKPHLLVIKDPLGLGDPTPAEAEFVKYALGALRGDRPSRVDWLGVAEYADALARLVLLRETAPLTVGIHGPWGKGKSSFMRFTLHQDANEARLYGHEVTSNVPSIHQTDLRTPHGHDHAAQLHESRSASRRPRAGRANQIHLAV